MLALVSGLSLFAGHLMGHVGKASDCLASTPPLSEMAWETIRLEDQRGESVAELRVRVADEPGLRAAGMQHLCPEAIGDNPMLFVFSRPLRPSFHMQNVHAPLDIVFMDANGEVVERHLMEPGSRLTSPETSISYALELASGQAEALGIVPGLVLRRLEADD